MRKQNAVYLISENRKPTRLGGKGICQVYESGGRGSPIDVSDNIAEKFGFTYNKGSIEIGYGSGTGFMRIQDAILKDDSKAEVFNVSVFNQ